MDPTSHIEIQRMRPNDVMPVMSLAAGIAHVPGWRQEDYEKAAAGEGSVGYVNVLRCGWVARLDERLVGFGCVQQVRLTADRANASACECELELILVDAEARRLGVASRLMQVLLDWCREQGSSILRLEVRTGNVAAIRLYERFGFVVAGRRPKYYRAPEEDALLMERRIA